MYNYQFPSAAEFATNRYETENSDSRLLLQLDMVESQIRECRAEIIAGRTRAICPEALQVIHDMETFLRIFELDYRSDLNSDHKAVIKANKDLGCYAAGTTYEDYIEEGR